MELIQTILPFRLKPPDIPRLREKRDIKGLTRLLQHPDFTIQWKAAEALGSLGPDAVDYLLLALAEHDLSGKLGAIEAFADIRDQRAVMPLINLLKLDTNSEVRWASALALGQIGDPRAIPAIEDALIDPDRYVRYGAVMALEMLSWTPDNEETLARMLIAQQEWETLKGMKEAAVPPLITVLRDPNPTTRQKAVELLGEIRGTRATKACELALTDPDPGVRWKAVLAAKKCRMPAPFLPWATSRRLRNRKSPGAAAILNFMFLGLGYNYLGKWWGFLVFQIYMTTLLMFSLWPVPFLDTWVFLISIRIPGIPVPIPVSLFFAIHAWDIARKMPDL